MELTIDQLLKKGIESHKAGKAQKADRYYTAILEANPKHPDANHNLGVLAVGLGKVETALPFFKTVLEANPNTAQFWLSYIDALINLNRLSDAKAVLEQAKNYRTKGNGFNKLQEKLLGIKTTAIIAGKIQDPPQDQLRTIINLYSEGQFQQALDNVSKLLNHFHNSATL